MHRTSGRAGLGLGLTLLTVAMWGTLPIALKLLLESMDAWTVTWYRFLVSAVLLGAWLAAHRALPHPGRLAPAVLGLLAVCALGLCANYLLFLLGLNLVSPAVAQIVIQLAPMFLLLGGLAFFGERFRARQWVGFAVLLLGMLVFFGDNLTLLFAGGALGAGVWLVFVAAAAWAVYALAQKALLTSLPSEAIMWSIYAVAVVLFLPASEPSAVMRLDGWALLLLAYCSVNTLIAYGCFAEALEHWEASRVSAVLAITPLLTLGFVEIAERMLPGALPPQTLDLQTLAGAGLVVLGSATTALGGARRG